MTTTTTDPHSGHGLSLGKVIIAALAGFALVLAFGVGALLAYQGQYAERIYPGVSVDGVDVSGMTREAAAATLEAELSGYADGEAAITVDGTELRVPYAALGRHADVDALVELAWSVGRSHPDPLGRAAQGVRSLLDGTRIEPIVTLDPEAVRREVTQAALGINRAPVSGTATVTRSGFVANPAKAGRAFPRAEISAALQEGLADPASPTTLELSFETATVEPYVTDAEVAAAIEAADRMVQDLVLATGKETWTVKASTVRGWISFETTTDGYRPTVAPTAPVKALAALAKKIDRDPRDATFLVGRGTGVVGVVAARNGRTVDVEASASAAAQAIVERASVASQEPAPVALAVTVTQPKLTTEQAEKAAPLMKRLSSWTTNFHRYEANGFGNNISIPTGDINGTVVAPGAVFDFWSALGPVTYERGYRDGGAILNGRTEPTGALAGGICSCSTTLFNAAARAGLEILSRANHYYYIDRYPTGLDATVWKTGGAQQSMRFRNDTRYPLLIKGYTGSNYVTFEIWGPPTGRTVSFSAPTIRNVVRAIDTVQYTTSLRPGQKKRIEYPVSGMNVWVSRVVRDAKGAVIHSETWFSDYKRVNGIVLVGKAKAVPTPPPATEPTPAPPPATEPSPAPSTAP